MDAKPGKYYAQAENPGTLPTITKRRLVVVGSTSEGVVCVLEEVYANEDPAHRLKVWSDPTMSLPFHHDVHLAYETTTVTYARTEA